MLDYLRELDSDFSVFHRIDPLEQDAYRFWSRAWFLDRYGGAVANRRLAEKENSMGSPAPTLTRNTPPDRVDGIPVVGSEQEARALSLRRFTSQHAHIAAEGIEQITDSEMLARSGFGG